jgi:DNA repair protein RecN (Recombination protein N)
MSATLASLRIRNLALVEDLLWEPPSGFVAITGETGAGKSIILGAVKLLLGERADKTLVRSGLIPARWRDFFKFHRTRSLTVYLRKVARNLARTAHWSSNAWFRRAVPANNS